MKHLRVALAQINPTVGDLNGNTEKIISYIKKARRVKADVVVFPELAVTGYPPEDLLLKPRFITENLNVLDGIRAASYDMTVIVGFVDKHRDLYNAAAVISHNRLIGTYHKKQLPNYGVFDEHRYFGSDRKYSVYNFAGIKIGITICEDIWYNRGPALIQSLSGAELIININASPYHINKPALREAILTDRAKECNTVIVYLNMVGGQDELVFDGGSLVIGKDGAILVRANHFTEEMITVDIQLPDNKKPVKDRARNRLFTGLLKNTIIEKINIPAYKPQRNTPVIRNRKYRQVIPENEVFSALVLGTRDYVIKNGFKGVIVGMSGGVDSALVTTIAVDALGKDNVRGIFMPSMYSSQESHEDAHMHAKNLGIHISTIAIKHIYDAYMQTLLKPFKGTGPDITEENLQARIRGNILMALSNKFGWLVLTTGNKSEMSVGYATLYGDMAGGFAVIKDVPKTLVYRLCQWRNREARYELIPGRILSKEPTAELRPDQKDTDTLPPYPVLDPILKAYVEDDRHFDEITDPGCDVECIRKVINMVDHAEYKRRQAPPGIKITPRAFGKDRRFPITNKYKNGLKGIS